MAARGFRFGVVAGQATSGRDWVEQARRLEGQGFATLVVPDGLQHVVAPFPALAAAAAATHTLRIGTYVLANDYRHPVMVAKEAATLDLMSGGRLELGIGAGRPSSAADLAMMGRSLDSGRARVDRLADALHILKPLLVGETVDAHKGAYVVDGASIWPLPVQRPVPLLIGASQKQLLHLAAREADIIALGIGPDAGLEQAAERIDWIREAAGNRFADIELNVNMMAVAGHLPRYLQHTLGPAATQLAQSDAVPVLKGSVPEMCDRLLWLRSTFGISYILVGEELVDDIAPVVARMASA
jgi:probable F420-dependent oxidoreductase